MMTMLVAYNMGICTKINQKTVIKAPDWFFVPNVFPVGEGVVRRSYTPHLEGDIPVIVMEFLCETETGEYSIRPTYPYGKLWYYERILKVPTYVIFDGSSGMLEVRELNSQGLYEVRSPDTEGRYWMPAFNLSLGVWYGQRINHATHWLRWWDESGNLLLWGAERIALEQQKVKQERQRASEAEQEIARLKEQLRQAGIPEPE